MNGSSTLGYHSHQADRSATLLLSCLPAFDDKGVLGDALSQVVTCHAVGSKGLGNRPLIPRHLTLTLTNYNLKARDKKRKRKAGE